MLLPLDPDNLTQHKQSIMLSSYALISTFIVKPQSKL